MDDLDEARDAADTEGVLFRPVGAYNFVRRHVLASGPKIGAHA